MARLKGTILVRYEPSLIFYVSGTVHPRSLGVERLLEGCCGISSFQKSGDPDTAGIYRLLVICLDY